MHRLKKEESRAVVLRSTGSWYDLQDSCGEIWKGRLRGVFKKNKSKLTNPIAVGDQVAFYADNLPEKNAVISRIFPRKNYIARQSTRKKAHGHLIAANIDLAVLVVTLAFPRTSLGFIDRFLVSAESFKIPALIVFNKQDRLSAAEKARQSTLATLYEGLGYSCLSVSALKKSNLAAFEQKIEGKISLLAGHSGVGKSTLLNQISADINQKTAKVSAYSEKGRHTTTFAQMFALPAKDTYLIDTPGIKEFGILDIENNALAFFFPEMSRILHQCKYHNCTHTHEPGCAVKQDLKDGKIAESRYLNYLSMLENQDNRR